MGKCGVGREMGIGNTPQWLQDNDLSIRVGRFFPFPGGGPFAEKGYWVQMDTTLSISGV